MAYSELIKRFEQVRDYMRDFLIFGFKTREDFRQKSPRTYDNERRRVESWLGEDLRWEYRAGGKAVFLSVDASTLSRNPFHRAWQSKSFTDNDITLHFFLLDLLSDGIPRHAEEITAQLTERYGEIFELPTVRRKLLEYTGQGLLETVKEGRRVCYSLSSCSLKTLFPDDTNLPELLSFFAEAAPLTAAGSYLRERTGTTNPYLRFKHHFIVHTLEDQILLTALEAIRQGNRLELTNVSGRSGQKRVYEVIPFKVLVSAQSGRRWLAARLADQRKFTTFRLDYIKALRPTLGQPQDRAIQAEGKERLAKAWGPVLSGRDGLQRFSMTVAVDEVREAHIIQRLRREGRGGTVEQVEPGMWRYTTQVHDISEMMNWAKTFIGRIVSVEGDDKASIDRFYKDVRRMAEMYDLPDRNDGG